MQHVLSTTTSASPAEDAGARPSASRRPAMRSESCSFIWHPKVRTTYLRVTPRGYAGARLRAVAMPVGVERRRGQGAADDTAGVEDDDGVGQRVDQAHVMLDEERGRARRVA